MVPQRSTKISETESIPSATSQTSPPRRTRSRVVLALAAVLALSLGSGFLTSCESSNPDRAAVINSVNASRSAHGLRTLSENVDLDIKADGWAQRMRNSCRISHSVLRDGAPSNWQKLGENVGRGGTIAVVHNAYMKSPGHRANVLDPAYNQMGAAAVWGTCNGARTVFTVHVFMKG